MKHARVVQTRKLRDGRQVIGVCCGHCDSDHWLLADATTLAYCLTHNLPMFIDGLGDIARGQT